MCVKQISPNLHLLQLIVVTQLHASVDCGHPIAPRNGSLESYTDTTHGSEVFYSCDPSLVPDGRMRAVCTGNGWSPHPSDLNCTIGKMK